MLGGIVNVLFAQGQVETSGTEIKKVKVGVTPYSMYQIWYIAKEYGIDKEFGIDLELVPVSQTMNGVQALVRGDLDITANCIGEHVPTFENAPQVVAFSTIGYFQGFFFVGRKGEVEPFADLVARVGLENAKESRLKEFKGKQFAVIPQRHPLIIDAISQVGLTEKDIKFLDFSDDQKAALAFMRGSADFYIGSLPQQRRLVMMEDEYVNAGGSEILGPAGLWYDNMVTTSNFLEKNRETALQLLGVLYRAVNLFHEKTEEVAIIGAKGISEVTGGEFSVDEYIAMQTIYDKFLTIEDAKQGYYNSESPLYWKYPVDDYVELAVKNGDLKGNVNGSDYYSDSEELFNEFLEREDLVNKVNSSF
jgi:ABC-type nitrate/sulfonate/bicarbonate transport system substrate-binding protein